MSSIFLPSTPPSAFTFSTASFTEFWTLRPSAAAGPVRGARRPILIVSCADTIPARKTHAKKQNRIVLTYFILYLLF